MEITFLISVQLSGQGLYFSCNHESWYILNFIYLFTWYLFRAYNGPENSRHLKYSIEESKVPDLTLALCYIWEDKW